MKSSNFYNPEWSLPKQYGKFLQKQKIEFTDKMQPI